MSGITLRLLGEEWTRVHAAELLSIAADIPGENWTADNYLYPLPRKWEFSIGAFDADGELAGFIIASQKDTAVHIHKFAVAPRLRSAGLGRQLLDFMEPLVRRQSPAPALSLYVARENPEAVRFYERNGFVMAQEEELQWLYRKKLPVTVGVHQPNFLPWLGYFYKIARSDRFVFLDHVVMDVTSAGVVKRAAFPLNGAETLLTMPLQKGEGKQQVIRDIRIDVSNKLFGKGRAQLQQQYRKHPFYEAIWPLVDAYFSAASPLLASRNTEFILAVMGAAGLRVPTAWSHALAVTESKSEMNAEIVKRCGGDIYLSGNGARDYNRQEDFDSRGLELVYLDFNPADERFQYPQQGLSRFMPGLSVVDALMNIGFDGLAGMLRS